MSRILLPPILKIVKLLTLSALGKISLNFEKLFISLCLIIRYHVSKEVEVLGCFSEKSSNRFLVITCIEQMISQNEIICKATALDKYLPHN